jgi:long-chain acyl-CoA synthetase
MTLPIPPYRSLALALLDRIRVRGDTVALRVKWHRQWEETTWPQLDATLHAAANALLEFGLAEKEAVGILAANRPEWTVADVATLMVRGVPVPVYPTSASRQVEYILNDAEVKVLFVDNQDHYDKARALFPKLPKLKHVVVFNRDVDLRGDPLAMHWEPFLARGRSSARNAELEERLAHHDPDDLLTIIYTSGTTGEPKGVMLTNANILAGIASHQVRLLPQTTRDVSLCFLPLSHVFERMWTYNVLYQGMQNNYVPEPKDVVKLLQEVRPTVMCAVPRFYEKVHGTIQKKLEKSPPLKRALFRWAVGVGAKYHTRRRDKRFITPTLALRYRLADKLVLSKIRDAVGGRIRFFPCAGAPLAPEIEAFLHAAGIFICYGYGLTETTATVTCHEPHHFRYGRVGKPMPGVEVRISPTGEVLVRGPTVMRGYYKKPEETAALLQDGWLHTGDAGNFDDNGELRITERIKDLFKNTAGKYVAPQQIESALIGDAYIEQAVAIGDARKFVTALVVPAFDLLEEYARENRLPFQSRDDLVRLPEVHAFYKQRIARRTVDLAPFERVKKFTLLPSALSIDNDEMTPTMKIRRRVVEQRHNEAISVMYHDHGGADAHSD